MPINPHCLKHFQRLGLPMDVILVDRHGSKITDVRIEKVGSATDLSNRPYDNPSALRNDLAEINGPTYPRLIWNGKDTRSLGVVPKP